MKKNEGVTVKVSPLLLSTILCFNFKENEDIFPTCPFYSTLEGRLDIYPQIFVSRLVHPTQSLQCLCCFGHKGCACGNTQFSDFLVDQNLTQKSFKMLKILLTVKQESGKKNSETC